MALCSLMHSSPLAKFHHLCAQVRAHCTLLDVAALADGRQERGDITGMSFEMERSSVYSAAQMKVSREEMHKAEREEGVARWGIYGRGNGGEEGKYLAASTSPTLLLLLPGRICPFTSFDLSLFLYHSFHQGKEKMKQVHVEVKMRGTKCMDLQTEICKWIDSAQIYSIFSTFYTYIIMHENAYRCASVRCKKQSAAAPLSLLTLHYILLYCTASPHGDH